MERREEYCLPGKEYIVRREEREYILPAKEHI